MAPVLAALLIVLSAPSGTLKLSDVARVYARRTQLNDATTMDLENTPRIETRLAWPTTSLDLDYAPRFAWVDVLGSDPSPTLLLHSAALRLSVRRPRYSLSLMQTGAIGDQDFSQLGAVGLAGIDPEPATPGDMTAAPELDLLPGAQVVRVASEETSASLRYAWSRRWSSELGASFGFSGGETLEAQQFLPQQRKAELDVSLAFAPSASDELGTALSGAQIRTSNGYDHWLASLIESWSVRWSESSGGELGLGAAIQDSTGPAGVRSTDWVPVGTASVRHALLLRHAQARVQWNVGYAPDINVLSGTLQSRLFASAQASLTIARSSLALNLGAARSYPRDAPDASELLSADLAFEHELLDWLSVQLGGQITRQSFASNDALSSAGSLWLLYAGLSGRVPEQHF
jgi:transposase-like protein